MIGYNTYVTMTSTTKGQLIKTKLNEVNDKFVPIRPQNKITKLLGQKGKPSGTTGSSECQKL